MALSRSIEHQAGTGLTYTQPKIQDIVVDNTNNLLYAPVFYWPNDLLYGILELNLTNGTKRWITTSSSPVALAPTNPVSDDDHYWGGHKLLLDAPSNTLYYSMGNGIWWWNRTTNATGVYNTQGGIPLMAGNPSLPSNLTTGMFIDHQQNKFYIGTHNGLFVWDRNTNTSKVYNTQNSPLVHNQVNTIDKSEDNNLIFVAFETGGLFTINTVSGEQKIYTKDTGNEVDPQMVHTNTASVYFDDAGKVLYVSSDNGGVWVKDYGNKLNDFGDLRVSKTSPALDKGLASAYPPSVTKDLDGLNRFNKYTQSADTNRLDLGPYEKVYACPQPTLNFSFTKSNGVHSFTPALSGIPPGENCTFTYLWNFDDGTTSTEANPQHTYTYADAFNVSLTVQYNCGPCGNLQVAKTIQIELTTGLCGNIYCDDNGGVSIGTLIIPPGYKFAVKGHVIMEGGKIILHNRWPDYVFEKDYELLPIMEVKRFINENGHLPGVPSAQTVKAEGINVEEMSILMLRKTEELTLYLLQIEERLRKLELEKKKTN
jgi:PKD repeat protein